MNPALAPSRLIVTAAEMQAIETRLFDAGIPVAALMEKVGQRLTQEIRSLFPKSSHLKILVLVGPGHNGGDALVIARELLELGYHVELYRPLPRAKPLTQAHFDFAKHIGIEVIPHLSAPIQADLIIDGLFGFGLERSIEGELATLIERVNQAPSPIVSLDLPSGMHTDTGEVLGRVIRAAHTFCLGLWKRAFFQEQALSYLGKTHLVPFGIPMDDQLAILEKTTPIQAIEQPDWAQLLTRSHSAHKYQVGSTLLVCGSARYPGAALLATQAANTTGVGMLYVAVPQSIQALIVSKVPEAVVIPCPETPRGAIADFPEDFSTNQLNSVAVGPGVTENATNVLRQCLNWDLPLIIDADGLNILAKGDYFSTLSQRAASTILTPHWGELTRLIPSVKETLAAEKGDRISLLLNTALPPQVTLILKGAKTLVKGAELQINANSTPALARGGSGDVLTGILAGLLAQNPHKAESIATAAVWWHAQAAILAEQKLTASGVSPTQLIQNLLPILKQTQHG